MQLFPDGVGSKECWPLLGMVRYDLRNDFQWPLGSRQETYRTAAFIAYHIGATMIMLKGVAEGLENLLQ